MKKDVDPKSIGFGFTSAVESASDGEVFEVEAVNIMWKNKKSMLLICKNVTSTKEQNENLVKYTEDVLEKMNEVLGKVERQSNKNSSPADKKASLSLVY
jgi:hypothetical protein